MGATFHATPSARKFAVGFCRSVRASEARGLKANGMTIRLASFADTPEGIEFASQLWRETVKECKDVSRKKFAYLK